MRKLTVKPKVAAKQLLVIGDETRPDDAWVFLGKLGETGPDVRVHYQVESPHVVAIVGKRGSGKSYTMGSFIESLCTKESESSISFNKRESAVVLFDTLGIFQWSDILLSEAQSSAVIEAQRKNLIGWGIEEDSLDIDIWIPRGSDRASIRDSREYSIRTSDLDAADWGYLLGLDIYQDRMGQLLNDIYIKVTAEGWSDGQREFEPSAEYSLASLVDCLEGDDELLTTYHIETRRAVLQQLRTYLRNPLFDDDGTSLNRILAPGRLSVIVLNRLSEGLRLVIASTLIRRLLRERTIASELHKESMIVASPDDLDQRSLEQAYVPPTWVAIDEAQNLLPSEKRNPAGEMLVRFVREGRNYNLSFIVATQQPTAIDARIMAQVDTLITHKLAVKGDIDYVRKNLKSSFPEEVRYGGKQYSFDDALRSLEIGQALISSVDASRAYFVNIRPRVSVHGGF